MSLPRNTKWGMVARHLSIGLASAAALAVSGGASFAQETFKLGGITSITGGGASVGRSSTEAWKLAVEDINAAGGILGKKVELIMADTMTDPTHGVSEARRLIENEKIEALVGPVTSQETIPIVAVTTEKRIVQATTAASSQLTPEVGPYHFSTSVTAANQMIPNIDFAIDRLGTTKFAIISDNGGMSKAGVSDLLVYLKEKKGLEPVAIQEFAFRTEDMTPQLLSLRGAGAEAILFMASLGDDARKLLENREDLGWDVPVLANQTMTNYAVGNASVLGEEAFEGVYSTQFVGMTYCEEPVGGSPFAKFVERARAAVPEVDKLGGAASLTPFYIEPVILAAAINGAGTADGEAVAKWLEANSDKVEPIIGPISVSDTNHFMPAPEAIKVVAAPHKVREDGLIKRADCAS
ncbi:ABC transporter substrate-binding protein [Aquibium sp. ELW1220]|uniref:ABC transporter substrate-binding protein n=1 Tax=Aquibium sp. ELW1220 TaxID=2976766 RepID=UPI0025AFEAC0|nr:ABC transporter substrate-binding protein [Aquibium sp. ELW1220]MDN2583324.1 ABC transporter substrate-binding protein [Aquibium sp. ELW1220]